MLQDAEGNTDYHPIVGLHKLLREPDLTISDAINIFKTELKYTEAEHKAIEFTGTNAQPIGLTIDITGD